jgi:hypothetical protein
MLLGEIDYACLLGIIVSKRKTSPGGGCFSSPSGGRKTLDFSSFYTQFSKDYPNLKQPSKEFLE